MAPAAPPTIAATSTLAMVRTAMARGARVDDLLAEAGIPPAFLEEPDARIAAPTVLALWHALRERTGDPALQLEAPTSLPFGAYRVIDYLVATSPTVGAGVERFVRFFPLIAEGVALRTVPAPDGVDLLLTMASGEPVPPVYVDYVYSALVSRIRMRIRPALRVKEVALRQPAPPTAARYREWFRAPVTFGAADDRLAFSGAEWAAPTESADEALLQLVEEHARMLAARAPRPAVGFRAEVEAAIAAALPEGGAADDVARALNVSTRTLQRRLEAAGCTFRAVSESVLARLAKGYLADPAVGIAEVSYLLGFSEQSAFNRAFRRWTGETPGSWRRRAAGA
jgi:AraC-like DNA-binding protein